MPQGKKDDYFMLDLRDIGRLEARQVEVQYVTKVKGPELMTALNRGFLAVGKMVALVRSHKRQAEKRLALRRAVVLLDHLPKLLKEKDIDKANEDIREAACNLDTEYARLEDRVDQLAAMLEVLTVMQRGFEKAHGDARRITEQWEPSSPNLNHVPGSPMPASAYAETGLLCPVCDCPQYRTPSGDVCAEGHGGVQGYSKES